MAQRRMFSLKIIDTDEFLDMPPTTQNLYFHLCMRADDDGFVSNPKKIMKIISSANDDMNVLITKKFVIPFDSGVCVIKHWKIHNLIRHDRYTETEYKEEKSKLIEQDNKYLLNGTQNVIPNGNQMEPQVRLGKDRKGKDSIDNSTETSSEPTVITIPLIKSHGEYKIIQSMIDKWKDIYPAIDILGTLKRIKQWNEDNSSRRKTKNGIKSHITKWLGKEQDKYHGKIDHAKKSEKIEVFKP